MTTSNRVEQIQQLDSKEVERLRSQSNTGVYNGSRVTHDPSFKHLKKILEHLNYHLTRSQEEAARWNRLYNSDISLGYTNQSDHFLITAHEKNKQNSEAFDKDMSLDCMQYISTSVSTELSPLQKVLYHANNKNLELINEIFHIQFMKTHLLKMEEKIQEKEKVAKETLGKFEKWCGDLTTVSPRSWKMSSNMNSLFKLIRDLTTDLVHFELKISVCKTLLKELDGYEKEAESKLQNKEKKAVMIKIINELRIKNKDTEDAIHQDLSKAIQARAKEFVDLLGSTAIERRLEEIEQDKNNYKENEKKDTTTSFKKEIEGLDQEVMDIETIKSFALEKIEQLKNLLPKNFTSPQSTLTLSNDNDYHKSIYTLTGKMATLAEKITIGYKCFSGWIYDGNKRIGQKVCRYRSGQLDELNKQILKVTSENIESSGDLKEENKDTIKISRKETYENLDSELTTKFGTLFELNVLKAAISKRHEEYQEHILETGKWLEKHPLKNVDTLILKTDSKSESDKILCELPHDNKELFKTSLEIFTECNDHIDLATEIYDRGNLKKVINIKKKEIETSSEEFAEVITLFKDIKERHEKIEPKFKEQTAALIKTLYLLKLERASLSNGLEVLDEQSTQCDLILKIFNHNCSKSEESTTEVAFARQTPLLLEFQKLIDEAVTLKMEILREKMLYETIYQEIESFRKNNKELQDHDSLKLIKRTHQEKARTFLDSLAVRIKTLEKKISVEEEKIPKDCEEVEYLTRESLKNEKLHWGSKDEEQLERKKLEQGQRDLKQRSVHALNTIKEIKSLKDAFSLSLQKKAVSNRRNLEITLPNKTKIRSDLEDILNRASCLHSKVTIDEIAYFNSATWMKSILTTIATNFPVIGSTKSDPELAASIYRFEAKKYETLSSDVKSIKEASAGLIADLDDKISQVCKNLWTLSNIMDFTEKKLRDSIVVGTEQDWLKKQN